GAGAAALRLPDAADHLIEAKIRAAEGPSLDGWLEDLAGGGPVPGGGSAAALAGALAGALVAMVARLTVGRKAYAAVERRDAKVAGALARAAVAGAIENVRVNVAGLSNPALGKELLAETERLERDLPA